jgi:hypothetical protein
MECKGFHITVSNIIAFIPYNVFQILLINSGNDALDTNNKS